MVKKYVREMLYFTLMAVLFYLVVRIMARVGGGETVIVVTAVVYALLLAGIYYLAGINSNSKENFWDVSPAAQCKDGNWYMWQGDDPTSVMCRKLASTPEGQCEIAAYSCPYGYQGTPKIPFTYTPLSNDSWQNERCEDKPSCSCTPKHDDRDRFTAFERTAPF